MTTYYMFQTHVLNQLLTFTICFSFKHIFPHASKSCLLYKVYSVANAHFTDANCGCMTATDANKTRYMQLIFKSTQRYEYFLHLVFHFLEKRLSCQTHRALPVCILRRSAKESRRSNRTLEEP